jgi:O-acetyl-ADP-ribose deacetylase (regulator of RNase III)
MQLPAANDYVVMVSVGDPDHLRLQQGDIAKEAADAIVNAANSELLAGAGVCGAILRAGGPAIADDCRRIRSEHGRVAPGQAVATTAGNLKARHVIHTVGPIWRGGQANEAETLASCYRESIRLADSLNCTSIAFPAISTGVFGYPIESAAWVAIPSIVESLRSATHVVLATIVLFDKPSLDTFAKAAFAIKMPQPYEVSILHD